MREDESLVQSFAVGNSARIDGEDRKNIELVQHTPKRDKETGRCTGKNKSPAPHCAICNRNEDVTGLNALSGLSALPSN